MNEHLAFVNLAAHGHVNPTLSLVEELVRRGHRVSYATGPELIPAVEAVGAEPVPLPITAPRVPADADMTPQAMEPMMRQMLDETREAFPLLRERFERDRPDAVCYDPATLVGRMLAEKLELPQVALVPNFASNERFSLREEIMAESSNAIDPNDPVLLEFGRRMRALTEEHGLDIDVESMMSGTPAALNVVFLPKEFQLKADTFDDRFVFVGPSLGGRQDRERWAPANEDAPLLFVSLGTVFHDRVDFYRTCIEAFGEGDWQVAMSVGERVNPSDLGRVPANFEVRPRFPQTAVLRRATAFLSHTGMNSTMESLYYGVPLVAVPQMPEQEANARQVEALGLGRRLDASQVEADVLRKTVDEVAGDESVRTALAGMRGRLRDCGGAVAGADAIEAHLMT